MTLQVPRGWLDALRSEAGRPHALIEGMHPKQRAFVRDTRTRKAWCAGRRSGKSHGLGGWFFDGMEKLPGERSVYVALSRSKAKQILWDGALERMRKSYDLPIKLTTSDGQLMIRHANGSSLWLVGCKDKNQAEKLRGERFYRAAVDEAQAFPDWLEYLVEDCLDPATMDLEGSIALTGTPSATPIGYFYEATQGIRPGFSLHHSTVLDNTSMPHAADWLRRKREALGWGEDHPTYRREWLGEWIDDPGSLVYPIQYKQNAWAPETDWAYGLPIGEYTFGLGVDLGFGERSTAFVLAAVRRGTGEIYILKAYTRSRLIPTALAVHVQAIRDKVRQLTGGLGLRVVVDEGALGGGYAEQMRSMGCACEPAVKREKRAYQELVNGLIVGGGLKCAFGECQELLSETRKLQFDPETGEEDDRYVRHCADAMLYIVRALFPRYDPEETAPEPGTPEWHKLEAKKLREKYIKDQEKRRRKAQVVPLDMWRRLAQTGPVGSSTLERELSRLLGHAA